ncbi:MAG: nucleotidyltransferase domain-containing protein [Ruminococcus sp.]|nr:nucleotidyltransferase domain-containing protein [Ruminococcus sp.]MDD6710445.1 nucleotidyltransferase domain-containing protein [Ruminococcus sp.]
MTLKELRKQKNLTQVRCAEYLGIPIRTYQNYENDIKKQNSFKYLYMMQKLEQYGLIDESHGILTVEKIKEICTEIFSSYNVDYCYFFGSYAKGKATENSDIDLLVCTEITGIAFYDLVEILREKLNKKVDILNLQQLSENLDLVNEILKDGIKIYG